ncbi:MAG: hypothetical protein ABSF53_23440 [Terracidiphilus sp.]|jgi:hypothetical protein
MWREKLIQGRRDQFSLVALHILHGKKANDAAPGGRITFTTIAANGF